MVLQRCSLTNVLLQFANKKNVSQGEEEIFQDLLEPRSLACLVTTPTPRSYSLLIVIPRQAKSKQPSKLSTHQQFRAIHFVAQHALQMMLQNSEFGKKPFFSNILCGKKKKEDEKHIQTFFENYLQSAGRYSVNFVLQRFVASYKFGSRPAINLCLELSLKPSGELEIKRQRQAQECADEPGKLVTDFLDA